MDWTQYSTAPKLSGGQRARLTKIKGALKRGAGGATKRLRTEQRGIYMDRRAANKSYNSPSYGAGSLSPAALDNQVLSSTRAKYGGAINQAEGIINNSAARQAQIKSYYDDYAAELGNIRTQQAQAQQAAIAATEQASQNTQKSEQTANQQAQQALSADAAARGQTASTNTLATANQASANRAQMANTSVATMRNAKNAYDNFYAQQGLIQKQARQGAFDKEAKYTKTLQDKLKELMLEAGDFATNTRTTLDENQFNRSLATKTLGLKSQSEAADAANAAARLGIAQQNADANSQRADWATSPNNPDNQPKSAKPPKRDKSAETSFRKARSLANSAVRNGKLKKGQGKAFVDALVNEKGISDDLLAKAATEYALYGGVSKATQRAVSSRYNFKLRLSATAKKKK